MGVLDEMAARMKWLPPCTCDTHPGDRAICMRRGPRQAAEPIATRLRAILGLDVYREREAALEALCVELEGA